MASAGNALLPADERATIDRLAAARLKNGPAFEALIREKQRDDPRFAFLFNPSSPGFQYYCAQVELMASSNQAHISPTNGPEARPPPPPQSIAPPPPPPPKHAHIQPPPPPPQTIPPQQKQPTTTASPAPRPLSALSMPVGLLADVLRARERRREASGEPRGREFVPLLPSDLPRTVPATDRAPPEYVLAAVERFYSGSPLPLRMAKEAEGEIGRRDEKEEAATWRGRSGERAPGYARRRWEDDRVGAGGGGGPRKRGYAEDHHYGGRVGVGVGVGGNHQQQASSAPREWSRDEPMRGGDHRRDDVYSRRRYE